MKRLLAVLVGTGVAVGGGVAAWAGPGGPNREAAKACLAEARQATPDAAKPVLREAVRACLEAQGITPGERKAPTPEQQAKREALRACLEGVKSTHPDAEKSELRDLAKPCFEKAGVSPGRIHPKRAEARECLATVRRDHPDADKPEVRRLVKECVQAE